MTTPTVRETPRSHACAMRLVFLVPNDAWVFTWRAGVLMKLHGAKSRFYTEQADAVADAEALGLGVDPRTGLVYVASATA